MNSRIDVISSGIIRGIATNIDRLIGPLVHPNIVDVHRRRELQILEVLSLETGRHAEVHDDVLEPTLETESMHNSTRTIGSSEIGL